MAVISEINRELKSSSLWVIKKFAEFIVFKWANMAKTTANMKTQKTECF